MRTLIFAALALVGCADLNPSPMNEQGSLRLCLGADDPSIDIDYTGDGLHSVFRADGTVQPVDDDVSDSIVTCTGDDPLWVQIDDGDTRWWFGIDARDATGSAYVEALDLSEGDAVSLTFLVERGWSMDNAAALTDARGLVFAAEEGWSADLESEGVYLEGLEVSRGDEYGRGVATDCGRQRARALQANGITIDVGQTSPVALGDDSVQVSNVQNWDFATMPTCTDTWGPSGWVAAR